MKLLLPLLFACLIGACGGSTPATSFEFAVMGDAPYRPENVTRVEQLIQDVNADGSLQWVIHLGDIKGGSAPCDDAVLQGRLDLFNQFEIPFLYTPGDNDWYDCVRERAGSWNRDERLTFIRSLFFARPTSSSAGMAMNVQTQSTDSAYAEFVENQMWKYGNVTFATVHLLRVKPQNMDSTDAAHRLAAGTAWIKNAFQRAKEEGQAGVFLATQVDPWPWNSLGPVDGIESLYDLLAQESAQFDGQVVLAVGDTHIYRVDKPLYSEGSLVHNFTRMEVFGDPVVGWVRVRVDPQSDQLFSFSQQLIE